MGPVLQALAGRTAIVLPLVPLGLALFLFVIPPAPRGTHLHSVLAILLLLAGLPVVALNALVSGPGAAIALAHGATLVLGPAAALVVFSRIRRGRPVWHGTATDLWFALAVAAALWSVAAGVAAGWQAVTRAAGQPYCLARHTSCRSADHLACRSARLCLLHDRDRLQGQLELVFPRPADRRCRLWPPSLQLVAATPAIRSAGPPGSFHCRHSGGVRAQGAVPAQPFAAVMPVHPGPNIQSAPATVAFGHVGPPPPRDQGKAPRTPPP